MNVVWVNPKISVSLQVDDDSYVKIGNESFQHFCLRLRKNIEPSIKVFTYIFVFRKLIPKVIVDIYSLGVRLSTLVVQMAIGIRVFVPIFGVLGPSLLRSYVLS